MTMKHFAALMGGALVAISFASAVAALDVACCNNGGGDPEPPNDYAPPPQPGGDEDEGDGPATLGGGSSAAVFGAPSEMTPSCEAAGGAYMRAAMCYDRDGNFVPL